MPGSKENTSKRKKEHLEICLKKDVSFKYKTNGLDKYEFEHNALTETDINKIDLSSKFLQCRINYPFLISCMTGGTYESVNINKQLALAAERLNIPIGVGSQRQALENKEFINSFKVIREYAGNVPVLGNIGAAQVAESVNPAGLIDNLAKMIDADAVVIHLNPLQELFQKAPLPNFKGLLKAIEKACAKSKVPVIVKEVGAGISASAALKLINAGVKAIDVAGAGGTNWAAVEMIRNKNNNEYFKDWGLTTSYCIKEIAPLKKKHKFTLIASGGISSGADIAKSIALGADMAASANVLLKRAAADGADGVVELIEEWFNDVKKIMFLTGADNLKELSKVKLIKKEEMY